MEYHDSSFHVAILVNDDDDDVVRACHNNFYRTNQDVHDELQDVLHVREEFRQACDFHCHVPVDQCNQTNTKLLPNVPNIRTGRHVPLDSATIHCKFFPISPQPTHVDTLRLLCDIVMSPDSLVSELFRHLIALASCEFAVDVAKVNE